MTAVPCNLSFFIQSRSTSFKTSCLRGVLLGPLVGVAGPGERGRNVHVRLLVDDADDAHVGCSGHAVL